jgi:hypothetical protein
MQLNFDEVKLASLIPDGSTMRHDWCFVIVEDGRHLIFQRH